MKTTPARPARGAAGFTMVELMVALTIGLVLTLVVAQLFIGSRRTFATTDDISRMQENMRFSSQLLSRTIHLAGYRTSPNTKAEFVFAAPNLAIDGVAGAGPVPDTFTVSYQGSGVGAADGTVLDCAGVSIAPNVMSVNTFTIELVGVLVNGVNVQRPSLVCRTNTDGFAIQHVIAADVDNMKILYGQDTNGDGSADSFVPRASVANINTVVALRIAMLFRSPNIQTATQVNTNVYTLHAQALPPFNDTRARRDLVFTAGIRNRSL